MPLLLSVPVPCVQGNTDPAPASIFWLLQRWMAAKIIRHNSGQRNLFTLTYGQDLPFPFLLGCPRPCPPHTAPEGSPGAEAAAGAPHGQGRRQGGHSSLSIQTSTLHGTPVRALDLSGLSGGERGFASPFRNLCTHPYFPLGCVKHITITFPLPVSYSSSWFPLLQFLHAQ